jgi:hypothetical protein
MAPTMQRSVHDVLAPQEAADRLAIRELVDAYAFCADRRDVEGQMSLFTADTEFLVYMDSRNDAPSQEVRGREALRPVRVESGTRDERAPSRTFGSCGHGLGRHAPLREVRRAIYRNGRWISSK